MWHRDYYLNNVRWIFPANSLEFVKVSLQNIISLNRHNIINTLSFFGLCSDLCGIWKKDWIRARHEEVLQLEEKKMEWEENLHKKEKWNTKDVRFSHSYNAEINDILIENEEEDEEDEEGGEEEAEEEEEKEEETGAIWSLIDHSSKSWYATFLERYISPFFLFFLINSFTFSHTHSFVHSLKHSQKTQKHTIWFLQGIPNKI